MGRPRSENPKVHLSIVRQKQPNGWTYVKEISSVYDPKIKNSRKISSKLLGKLPPGETDLTKMVETNKNYSRKKKTAADIVPTMQGLNDDRDPRYVIYPLAIALIVIIMAHIAGFTSSRAIAEYWKTNRAVFEKWFSDFPSTDISHDTVRRLTMLAGKLNSDKINQCTAPLLDALSSRVIAVDGQAVRTAGKTMGAPQYFLNVYDSDNQVCLEHVLIGAKENEITRAARLIGKIDISGAVITCDALNTQEKFARAILNGGADYCLALKNNHSHMYEEVRGWFKTQRSHLIEKTETEPDKGHGRIEVRTVRVLPSSVISLNRELIDKWPGLEEGCLVEISCERTIVKTGETSTDTRYYLTSLHFDERYIAKKLMRIIRQHWRIENSLHWVLDVTYDQDHTQCKNAEFLKGKVLVDKIAYNWVSKLQQAEEEETGKDAFSRPVWKVRMSNADGALRYLAKLHGKD